MAVERHERVVVEALLLGASLRFTMASAYSGIMLVSMRRKTGNKPLGYAQVAHQELDIVDGIGDQHKEVAYDGRRSLRDGAV